MIQGKGIVKTTTVLVSLLFLSCFFPLNCTPSQTFTAYVSKTIDGDSIEIRHGKEVVQVRLWGIDTPEWKQPYSKLAKKFTYKTVYAKTVTVKVKDWDKYGRMVAVITTRDGMCLNEELVRRGFAWVHIYYCKEKICDSWNDLERRARNNRWGLWQEKSPTPPWVWKRKHKRR